MRSSGLFIAQLFWGLWLFPFGVLVIKSGFIPKILGYLLIIACFAYVIATVLFIDSPAHMHPATHLLQPLEGLGEGAIIVWLLAKGVREPAHAPLPTRSS